MRSLSLDTWAEEVAEDHYRLVYKRKPRLFGLIARGCSVHIFLERSASNWDLLRALFQAELLLLSAAPSASERRISSFVGSYGVQMQKNFT